MELVDIEANGFTFTCRRAGNSGPGVILLHGFPETSHMWTPLLERLAAAGYRALAPDQRGYSAGARPEGAENYHYQHLAADVIALADAEGFETFHLVGHDHGAGVGWSCVFDHPERVMSWCALSVPHIAGFADAIRNDPDQQERSQYIQFFQQPGAAEAQFSANDFEPLRGVWSASDAREVDAYLEVLTQPGALTGALNWYRGSLNLDQESAADRVRDVSTPTLLIWGNQDRAIGRTGVERSEQYMKGPYRFVELDAGHWLIQEETERVCGEIMDHLERYGRKARAGGGPAGSQGGGAASAK